MPTPRQDETDSERLFELLNGLAISQIVAAAAQLDIANHLSGEPLTVEQLAGRTKRRSSRCAGLFRHGAHSAW